MANSAFDHTAAITLPGSSTNTALVRWSGTGADTLTDSTILVGATTMGLAADTDLLTFSNGTLTIGGTLAATTLTGAGSGITGLNASNLGSGTIPDARFPATLPAISGANLTNLPAAGATLSGSTDNTVVTVTGSNAMVGEANLTFDGTKLGINTAAPDSGQYLHIVGANGSISGLTATTTSQMTVENNSNAAISILSPAADFGAIYFGDADSNIAGGLIYNHGATRPDVRVEGSTKYILAPTLMTIPGGINFPDTQVASADVNTLDDYEEGSWTPILYDNSRSSESQSGDQVVGRYTKIGNQVFITGHYRSSSLGSLTTTEGAYIGGLPFTSANINTHYHALAVANFAGFDNLSAGHGVYAGIYENNDFISLRVNDSSNSGDCGTTHMLISEFSANGNITFSGNYHI